MPLDRQEEIQKITAIFRNLGADPDAAPVMAAQLLKRARQMAEEESISKVDALSRLLEQIVTARS